MVTAGSSSFGAGFINGTGAYHVSAFASQLALTDAAGPLAVIVSHNSSVHVGGRGALFAWARYVSTRPPTRTHAASPVAVGAGGHPTLAPPPPICFC